MMKTNGLLLAKDEFITLAQGDVYFVDGKLREFLKFIPIYTDPNIGSAIVSTDGKSYSSYEYKFRWPTGAEYASFKNNKVPIPPNRTGLYLNKNSFRNLKLNDVVILEANSAYPTDRFVFFQKHIANDDNAAWFKFPYVGEIYKLARQCIRWPSNAEYQKYSSALPYWEYSDPQQTSFKRAEEEITETKTVEQKTSDGLPCSLLTRIDYETLIPGYIIYADEILKEVKYISYNTVITTDDQCFHYQHCRWPLKEDIEKYKTINKKESSTMKTTGKYLSQKSFDELEKGDLFVYRFPTSFRLQIFEEHRRLSVYTVHADGTSAPAGTKMAFSSGSLYDRADMRWPTTEEYLQYRKVGTYSFPRNHKESQDNEANEAKEETTMATNNSSVLNKSLCVVKDDAVDAAWRAAAKQAVKSAKVPLLAFLGAQKLPGSVLGFMGAFADTDNGEAVLAFVLGVGITYVPNFGTDPKFVRLAKELRVLGMESFMTKVMDVMLNPIRDQIVELVKSLPFASPE